MLHYAVTYAAVSRVFERMGLSKPKPTTTTPLLSSIDKFFSPSRKTIDKLQITKGDVMHALQHRKDLLKSKADSMTAENAREQINKSIALSPEMLRRHIYRKHAHISKERILSQQKTAANGESVVRALQRGLDSKPQLAFKEYNPRVMTLQILKHLTTSAETLKGSPKLDEATEQAQKKEALIKSLTKLSPLGRTRITKSLNKVRFSKLKSTSNGKELQEQPVKTVKQMQAH